jgi:hypothetical protein
MLRIRYNLESSNYFLDNGDLTRDLMIAIEGLFFTSGIPTEGEHTALENGLHLWVIMGHIVVYRLTGDQLIVRTVMPVE